VLSHCARGILALLLVLSMNTASADQVEQATPAGQWRPVSPRILSIRVRTQRVEFGRQVPYSPLPGDEVKTPAGNDRVVFRRGKAIGTLVGRRADILWTFDRVLGRPLDTAAADRAASYTVQSPDDAHYAPPVHPVRVHRKSRPYAGAWVGWGEKWPDFEPPVEHVLYLELPEPLTAGMHYTVTSALAAVPPRTFLYDPRHMRSEAVHVSQVGFRPDDPVKVAFLSCWMGSGGGLSYGKGLRFDVLDDNTGKSVFKGPVRLLKAATEPEAHTDRNYNGTDVYGMDFSGLRTPGTYRVYVEGVGCSHPFEIGRDVWRKASRAAMRGLYHHRSGIALGPPYTTYRRPRPFHPADGVKVFASTACLMDTNMGIGRQDAFRALLEGKTERVLQDAWGGYMDAADWDRRAQHLRIPQLLLDLVELFPERFGRLDLNIPESGDGLPDAVNEALWSLDFFRRLQTAEGGIRGGVESAAHPRWGECSWQESQTVMAYAPDPWASYLYAAAAAQAARWFSRHNRPEMAGTYRDSALRAMEWAERDLVRRAKAGEPTDYGRQVQDARNAAAAQLYRLTGQRRWHELFLATTPFRDAPGGERSLYAWARTDQRDAVWAYLRTAPSKVDPKVRRNCLRTLLDEADRYVDLVHSTAFHWAKKPYNSLRFGTLSGPTRMVGEVLLRAHVMSGDPKYLKALILACQCGLGGNPLNLCYTTGLGWNYPHYTCHLDSRFSNQPNPAGITVYGPADTKEYKDHWAQSVITRFCYPPADRWPTTEAYWDLGPWWPMTTEYTVVSTIVMTAYVWGYLDGRQPAGKLKDRASPAPGE